MKRLLSKLIVALSGLIVGDDDHGNKKVFDQAFCVSFQNKTEVMNQIKGFQIMAQESHSNYLIKRL